LLLSLLVKDEKRVCMISKNNRDMSRKVRKNRSPVIFARKKTDSFAPSRSREDVECLVTSIGDVIREKMGEAVNVVLQ